jgi:hypothetical protein
MVHGFWEKEREEVEEEVVEEGEEDRGFGRRMRKRRNEGEKKIEVLRGEDEKE